MLERPVRELQGTRFIALEHEPSAKQHIACTRSFGHPDNERDELTKASTEFASHTAKCFEDKSNRPTRYSPSFARARSDNRMSSISAPWFGL